MTGLLSSDGDGFENDADVSSQSEAEEKRLPREKGAKIPPGLGGGSQRERWDHLFAILEQQHIHQLTLQREHHDRQVDLLQMQLAHLSEKQEGLITKQQQEPLGYSTKKPRREATTKMTTAGKGDDPESQEMQPRITPNGQEGSEADHRQATSESSQHETDSLSGDSDRTLEGSLEEASGDTNDNVV